MDTLKYPVKIHPDHESNNCQEELALTANNAEPQRCYKSDDVEMNDKENQWIQKNISMRVCTTFVQKEETEICHCGYNRSYHIRESQTDKWDEQQHTKTEPTNAFGKVEFQGFGQKIGRYVRVDYNTDMNKIIDLMKNEWKLQLPNLLISVTGGAKNFQMKPQLKEVFRRGLVKVARSTGAWVTSAGLNAGVMKHVGEAIRDYGFTLSGRDKVVAIGIAPWGCVQNKDNLINKNGMWPAQYDIKVTSQEGVSPLDPNHSHFILVDNGTQYIFGTEIEFRANLERRIANEKISEAADVTIPVVVVMVEGGPGTLKTVYNSVRNNNPVIIVKGSGRAADIMAYAYQNATKSGEDEFNKKSVISYQLEEDLKEKISKEFGRTDVEKLFNLVRDSLNNLNLITVFEMGSKDSARDIDMSVLKALLKARENKLENLRLILEWNRIDVAKSEIFTDETQWPTGMLDNLMFSALLLDRVDFVKLFLEYGVSLKTFLSKDRLEELYQKTKMTPLQESLFNNGNKNESNIGVKKIADVINDLMGDDYFQYSYYNKDQVKEKYSFPANELFLWAVLMNRREMAFLFWKEGMEGLPAALVANRLLKAMKQRSQDYDQMNKLQEHAELFEKRAIGVLTECYASDEKMALQLLVQQRENWGHTSCILIAVNADNKRFISQTACQSLLSNIWMGKMNNSNSNWKLIVSIFFPLFILLLIKFDKKNSEKDQCNENGKKNGVKTEAENFSWKEKILAFYTAPVITFITNVGFYVVFLIIFSYVLLVELQDTFSNMEILLYVWVFTIFTEELRQVYFRSYVRAARDQVRYRYTKVLAKYSSSMRIKIVNYITDIWNIVDMINILLFFSGIMIRWFQHLENARIVLSFNLILFYFRVLHIFSVHKELGPKLVMIKKMVQDLMYFVAILFVFMVAYGIASQAILYPSTPFSTELFKGVLRKPYFQMYGELFLPEIEGEECNESSMLDTFEYNLQRKCPTEIGTKLVPVMMGIYILLTNILLLNLLIAMFSNTFQKIQDNTDLHWHFQRFGLISEYDTRPPLPPPFILLSHIYLLFCVIIRKFKAQKNKDMAFKKNLCKIEKQLMHWEDEMVDCYLREKEKLENNSMEGKVFIASDRTEQMMMKIEELQHQQQHLSSAPMLTELIQSLLHESHLKMTERLSEVENQVKQVKEILMASQSSGQEK